MENEFKGTKCKWEKNTETLAKGHRATKSIYITDEYGYTLCKMIDPDRECQEFNAQLISKAPEMLEKLKEIVDNFYDNMSPNVPFISELEDLIKEATSIQ